MRLVPFVGKQYGWITMGYEFRLTPKEIKEHKMKNKGNGSKVKKGGY